uniref:WAP domain-containing protein n=1 Tax=Esox lucius TaxID=8010 RepID=A0AAY5K6W1_ESOLU
FKTMFSLFLVGVLLDLSQEFTAKPGSCPGVVVESPRNTQCKWDSDCPGWQKCCQREGPSLCTDPEPTGEHKPQIKCCSQ